jgi:hypothetical protein
MISVNKTSSARAIMSVNRLGQTAAKGSEAILLAASGKLTAPEATRKGQGQSEQPE